MHWIGKAVRFLGRSCSVVLAGYVLIQSPMTAAQDKGLETGVEDDLTVKGTNGTKSDPDVELYGYTAFGTSYVSATMVTSGVGNVFVQNNLEVGSNLYARFLLGDGSAVSNVSARYAAVAGYATNAGYSAVTDYATNSGYAAVAAYATNAGYADVTRTASNAPVVITVHAPPTATAWSLPTGTNEFLGATRHRTQMNLTYATQARITVLVAAAGTANASIRGQYSPDSGANWYHLDGASGPSVSVSSTGLKVSSPWVNLAAGAKADVWLRLVGCNGTGGAGLTLGLVTLQCR